MKHFVCIHGHFYQPPRENPWTGKIERQESASPFHDWNQRVTAECYLPNSHAKILDKNGYVRKQVNNYALMSFNFGPTLLSWLEKNERYVYNKILEADQESQKYFHGHGSAIAQAYNHMIMPLANTRDKRTQILWGIKDFEYRFNRKPEGMWLPETAVDLETLDLMAQAGIKFTLLAPGQAKRTRPLSGGAWLDVDEKTIDTRQPYLCRLPNDRHIVIFVYNGGISHDVAFGQLLKDGHSFGGRFLVEFPKDNDKPLLAHMATDGETYGHHHKFTEMALAYVLDRFASSDKQQLTIYGDYLQQHPPEYEIEIKENTAWSCAHGVGRWEDDCGCAINPGAGWNQKWRKPLRVSLNWLRNEVSKFFEAKMQELSLDGWAMREAYIDVVLKDDEAMFDEFLNRFNAQHRPEDEKRLVRALLEMQKFSMLMFTSCGWFFDDIGGLEVRQILQYAARAIELAQENGCANLEESFLELLSLAKSNDPKIGDGRKVYQNLLEKTLKKTMRSSGILCHISSLPSSYGVGDFGPAAYEFVDFLSASGQSIWQILPLNPVDATFGNSPYSSSSAYAGNILFISPEMLIQEGLLEAGQLEAPLSPTKNVDYDAANKLKISIIEKSFQNYKKQSASIQAFDVFCHQQSAWLDDYALFVIAKKVFNQKPWSEWPSAFIHREAETLKNFAQEHKEDIEKVKWAQYLFSTQWEALRSYANNKGIKILGDLPIYVNYDSSDVWAHPLLFKLDKLFQPTHVSGVPPDYFSETGQRWGNPVYNWKYHEHEGFAWWVQRLRHNFELYDLVRIDHFRGLVAYWEIPAAEKTAVNGYWVDVPVYPFFDAVAKHFPKESIIAEDLGVITPDVVKVMEHYQFPGMKILLFAFGDDMEKNPYLPHHYVKNCVVYTGTHDNNTAQGWFLQEADKKQKIFLKQYIQRFLKKEVVESQVHWLMIDLAMQSLADTAIIPIQDVLGLGQDCRMNMPGTTNGNWQWRLLPGQITPSLSQQLAQHTTEARRF